MNANLEKNMSEPTSSLLPNPQALRDRVLTLTGVTILLLVSRYASPIVVPFLLALFITVVAIGPIRWLKKRGFSAPMAVSTIILIVIIANVLVAIILGSTITQFTKALPNYQTRLIDLTQNFFLWGGQHGIHADMDGLQQILNP